MHLGQAIARTCKALYPSGALALTTGVATLQIFRKELDPNDWWPRMTGKKANDGS
jgi:hypothetical protein